MEATLSADKTFAHIPIESFIECDTFLCNDRILLSYLVAYDEKNDLEAFRQEVVIDIAFADDFGFGS